MRVMLNPNKTLDFYLFGIVDDSVEYRAATGFVAVSDLFDRKVFVDRTTLILNNHEISLQLLDKLPELIKQVDIRIPIRIFLPRIEIELIDNILNQDPLDCTLGTEEIVKRFVREYASFSREGRNISLSYAQRDEKLIDLVTKALHEFKVKDDFFHRYVLSPTNSKALDYSVLETFEFEKGTDVEFIEYMDETSKLEVPGIKKRFVTLSDLAFFNKDLTTLSDYSIYPQEKFPYEKPYIANLIRRTAMVLRDCDVFFLITNFSDVENFNTFKFPDYVFIFLAQYYQKKIYVLNNYDRSWYKLTEAKKVRSTLVKAKTVDINNIQTIGYYTEFKMDLIFQEKFIPIIKKFLKNKV